MPDICEDASSISLLLQAQSCAREFLTQKVVLSRRRPPSPFLQSALCEDEDEEEDEGPCYWLARPPGKDRHCRLCTQKHTTHTPPLTHTHTHTTAIRLATLWKPRSKFACTVLSRVCRDLSTYAKHYGFIGRCDMFVIEDSTK